MFSSVALASIDTHGMRRHVELITDNNGSTCLTIPNEKPVQLVAELTYNIPINNASDDYVIIEVQLSLVGICEKNYGHEFIIIERLRTSAKSRRSACRNSPWINRQSHMLLQNTTRMSG